MTTNENPNDASKSERPSAGAGANRPMSMKERLLAERKSQGEDAPPVPASRPAAAKPAESAPAKPAASAKPAAAKPAAAPAPKATSARAAKPAAEDAPARATAKPAAARPSAARAKPARDEGGGKVQHADVQRELNLLHQRENKTMTIAWIAAGVLVLATGITYFVVESKKKGEEAARQAQIDLFLNFEKKALTFDIETEQGARDFVDFLDKRQFEGQTVPWQGNDVVGPRLTQKLGNANRTVQREVDKTDFFDKLKQVEDVVQNAASKSPDDVTQARRKIKLLEEKMDQYGDDAKKRVANCRLTIEKVYVERLWQDAKDQAKDPAKLRSALVSYASAEDACVTLFEKRGGVPDPTGDLQKFGGEKMKIIYDESDAAAYQLFTADTINKTEWTDCLSGDFKEQWQSDQVGGFQIQNGVMQIVGPDAGSGKIGLASVPKKIQWRDFQVEVEFEIVKGRADFYFRLLRRADSAVKGPEIVVGGDDGQLPPNKKVTMIATCVGSKLSYTFPGGELTDKTDEAIGWTRTRRGGFGLAVHPGSEIKVSKLKVRLLRVDPN
ncbi:MAG: hypothetical protein IPJ77_02700 [Planctomycetes bacterium]|nr:hypothetical protein [Planctomycetota bacterium]